METLKLEPEHILPYLAYGLKIIPNGSRQPAKVLGLELNPFNLIIVKYGEIRESKISLKWCKPLLLPLSELTDDLAEKFGYKNAKWYLLNIIKNQQLPYVHFVELLKLHYDVCCLLDKGVAISKV